MACVGIVLPEAAVSGYLTADLSNTWHVPKGPLGKELSVRAASV